MSLNSIPSTDLANKSRSLFALLRKRTSNWCTLACTQHVKEKSHPTVARLKFFQFETILMLVVVYIVNKF